MAKKVKKTGDFNQIAKAIVEQATSDKDKKQTASPKTKSSSK